MLLNRYIQRSARTTIAWNTISQLVGKIVGAGTTFLVGILIARRFGAEGYGDFTKIITYVAFFFWIADFGINAIYLRQQTTEEADDNAWPTLLGLRVIGSVILMFIALAFLALLPQGQTQGYTTFVRLGIIVFSPAILFQALITSTNAVFQKNLRYDFATAAVVAGSVFTLLFLFAMTAMRGTWGILMGVMALFAGSAVTACVALLLVRRIAGTIRIVLRVANMKRMLLPSIPLGLTLFFNLVYFHVDSVILTLTRTTAEVGIYGLAYKLFEVPLVLPTFFVNALYPLMLRAFHSSERTTNDEFMHLVRRSMITLVVLSFVTGIFLWIVAPYMTLIRSDFAASVPVLRILIMSLPIFFVSSLTMWILITLGKQKLLMVIYGTGMIINVFLNAYFIPRYGYIAAAWITVMSEGFVLALSGFTVYKILPGTKSDETH